MREEDSNQNTTYKIMDLGIERECQLNPYKIQDSKIAVHASW